MMNRMKTQINVLTHILVLTWEMILATACQIYNAVIRPVMTHDTAIWHSDLKENATAATWQQCAKSSVKKLITIQNKCLWVVIKTYKIILIVTLKTEIHISSLNLYLNARMIAFRHQHKNTDMKRLVRRVCKKIQTHFWHSNTSRELIRNEYQLKWAEKWRENSTNEEIKTEKKILKKNWKKW